MIEQGSITLNRSCKPEDVDLLREVILICYMDGSNAAKAFVAYIRYLLESGLAHVALLAAKSKLNPVHTEIRDEWSHAGSKRNENNHNCFEGCHTNSHQGLYAW